jgi:hypothetical protein
MKKGNWLLVTAATQILALAGCVAATMAPTVVATPGPGKLPADLTSDTAACVAQTNQQMAPVVQAANNQIVGNALLGAAVGAGASAAGGASNGATAANAAANAASAGGATAQTATATLQQQYDAAYSSCMYAKGDNVPPYYMQPVAGAEQPSPVHHRRYAHKKPAATPASATFVEPAPVAAAAPATSAASGSGFAVPPPASH